MVTKRTERGEIATLVSKQRMSTVTNEANSFAMYLGYEIGEKTEESCLA